MTRLTKVLCFIGLTIAMFMGTLDTTIVNIAIPKIMTELHGSLANTSWVMTDLHTCHVGFYDYGFQNSGSLWS